jgi:hypothetical protein
MSVDRATDVGSPSRNDLAAPVRARSILASTHQLQVEDLTEAAAPAPRSAPPSLSPAAVRYGFVAVDAVPYLVWLGEGDLRPGPVLAVATGLDEQLGELHLAGELGEWIYPSTDLRVADVLQEHAECMVEPVRELMQILRMRVAPIRLSAIWTHSPSGSEPVFVDPDSFEAADPDPWAAFAHEAIRHLNEHHHDDLLNLARAAGARGCTGVGLTGLEPGGAILTAMSQEGLVDIVIPLDPPASTPGEASRRLTGSH